MILNFILFVLLIILALACLFSVYFVFVLLWTKVPFIPSKKHVVARMVELAELNEKKVVYDLGCGNGRILFSAERLLGTKNHAAFTGYEINASLVWYTKLLNFMRRTNIKFVCRDFFKADLADADIIFMYLWPTVMERFFSTQWKNLKPGTKVISHAFKIDSLDPIYSEKIDTDMIYIYER